MITISKLSQTDIPQFSALIHEAVCAVPMYPRRAWTYEDAKYTPSEIRKKLKSTGHYFFVAKDAKRVIGGFHGTANSGVCAVEWLAVTADYRRKSVGTDLATYAAKYLRAHGVHKLWMSALVANTASNALLKNMGCHRVARVNNHWFGTDNYFWEKLI